MELDSIPFGSGGGSIDLDSIPMGKPAGGMELDDIPMGQPAPAATPDWALNGVSTDPYYDPNTPSQLGQALKLAGTEAGNSLIGTANSILHFGDVSDEPSLTIPSISEPDTTGLSHGVQVGARAAGGIVGAAPAFLGGEGLVSAASDALPFVERIAANAPRLYNAVKGSLGFAAGGAILGEEGRTPEGIATNLAMGPIGEIAGTVAGKLPNPMGLTRRALTALGFGGADYAAQKLQGREPDAANSIAMGTIAGLMPHGGDHPELSPEIPTPTERQVIPNEEKGQSGQEGLLNQPTELEPDQPQVPNLQPAATSDPATSPAPDVVPQVDSAPPTIPGAVDVGPSEMQGDRTDVPRETPSPTPPEETTNANQEPVAAEPATKEAPSQQDLFEQPRPEGEDNQPAVSGAGESGDAGTAGSDGIIPSPTPPKGFRRRVADFIDPSRKTDALTGVGTREELNAALPVAESDPSTHVVVFDANNFGKINKAPVESGGGQEAGDAQIKAIADSIKQASEEVGAGNRVFRRGGDEFVVLAPSHLAEQVRSRAEELYGEREIAGHKISLTGTTGDNFLEADTALQARKNVRKNGPPAAELPTAEEANNAYGVKNRMLDADRERRGLKPMLKPIRETNPEVWDRAMKRVERDPEAPQRLVQDLIETPRPLSADDVAILLHRKVHLENRFSDAADNLQKAIASGDEAGIVQHRAELNAASDSLQEIEQVKRSEDLTKPGSGTLTARGLAYMRTLANEDYTLAKMETIKRAGKGGEELTPAERDELTKHHEAIKKTDEAIEQHEQKKRAAGVDDFIKRAQELDKREAEITARERAMASEAFSGDKTDGKPKKRVFSKEGYEAAKRRALERMRGNTSFAGLDPETFTDALYMAGFHIETGVRKFSEFSKRMIEDLGEAIKPHLQDIWDKVKSQIPAEDGKPRERTPADPKKARESITEAIKNAYADAKAETGENTRPAPDEMRTLIQRLATHFALKEKVTDREQLINSVHDVIKQIDPDFTRDNVMDAISGYGDFTPLSKEPLKVKFRENKGEMQQLAKLRDMLERGQAPLKTGMERRTPSDTERLLTKQVNEAKKAGGYAEPRNKESALRSAMDAAKTRIRNSMADLRLEIATGERIVKGKTELIPDAELTAMRTEYEKLREEHKAIFGKKGMTDQQKLAALTKAAERSTKMWEQKIENLKAGKTPQPKTAPARPTSPELQRLQDARNAAKAEYEELQSFTSDKPVTKQQLGLAAWKRNTAASILEHYRRVAEGNYAPKPRRIQTFLDAEGIRLKAEKQKAVNRFKTGLEMDRLAKRTSNEKVHDALVRWRRAAVLSWPTVLGKLTSAAATRLGTTHAEELVGGAITKALPAFGDRARMEGGFRVRAEAKALTEGFTTGMKDSWDTLRTGKSNLDLLFGKKNSLPPEALEFLGHLHGALKAPVKRAAFARAFEKLSAHDLAHGIDPTDPVIQMKNSVYAYKQAQRSIFMQDNRVVRAYRAGIRMLEQPDAQGKQSAAGKAGATTAKILVPIVTVPTNVVAETFVHVLGLPHGAFKLAQAYKKGIGNLAPEEADMIMSHLKKGSLGAAAMIAGYLMPTVAGGYYQPGERRDKSDAPAGGFKIAGVKIPATLAHNPVLMTMQLGATIRRVADSKLKKSDPDTQGIGSGALAGAIGLVEEVPFVREMTEIDKLFNPRERADYLHELGKSMVVPGLVEWLARKMDTDAEGETVKRDPKTLMQSIESAIPGLRDEVPKKKFRG